jgi:hypothetical protein
MELIVSKKWILKLDPMILFYSLYFCVFYQNHELYKFFKELIDSLDLEEIAQAHILQTKQ